MLEKIIRAEPDDPLEKPSTIDQGRPLVAWYLAAAQRFLMVRNPSLTVLLTYAAVERHVDLCLWVDYGLDDAKPDDEKIQGRYDQEKYKVAGIKLFGKAYRIRDVLDKLLFGNGAQLQVALNDRRLTLRDLGPLKSLSTARNKCEYEHGLIPKVPDSAEVNGYLQKALAIASRLYDAAKYFEQDLNQCRFPQFVSGES